MSKIKSQKVGIIQSILIPSVLYGMVAWAGLLLRLSDERSITNPPQSFETYPQTTKRHERRNSTHKCKLDAIKVLLLFAYSKYNA